MNWLGQAFDFEAGAILNFNKPLGRSSFWLVKKVRALVQTKVGHAGTLDPFAEGVLLICTGKATKHVVQLMLLPKEYIGEIQLGLITDTDDPTGTVTDQHQVPELTREGMMAVCRAFVGDIYQLPPMFSAKKVLGERLYKIARQGKVIERKTNLVHIENIEVISLEQTSVKLKVTCSKGTYIRALARDIGQKIGCGGHLKSLVRTRIGDYTIAEALTLERFKQILF